VGTSQSILHSATTCTMRRVSCRRSRFLSFRRLRDKFLVKSKKQKTRSSESEH
jgi:hypothetical protein